MIMMFIKGRWSSDSRPECLCMYVCLCRERTEGGLLVYMPLSQCEHQRMSAKLPTETGMRWMRWAMCVCMQLCLCQEPSGMPHIVCAEGKKSPVSICLLLALNHTDVHLCTKKKSAGKSRNMQKNKQSALCIFLYERCESKRSKRRNE